MSIHSDLLSSPSARKALRRGLARQAMTHAAAADADMPKLFRLLKDIRPNRKGMERLARQLLSQRGVVSVRRKAEGSALAVVVRNLREVTTTAGSTDIFRETALLYTAIEVNCRSLHLSRLGLCAHGLERLVERSDLPLGQPMLHAVDAEAAAMMRRILTDRIVRHHDDSYVHGVKEGLWAGSLDHMPPEEDWTIFAPDVQIPIFSARIFLGPDEIKPMVWLKWKDQGIAGPKSLRR